MKNAIIYIHGFNSASLDLSGQLLKNKEKLVVLDSFCRQKRIPFISPNVDYRNFSQIIKDLMQIYTELTEQAYQPQFMGSSMGGFCSEYMALKTGRKAMMINPVLSPTELLPQFIGSNENFETGEPYHWQLQHCQQYQAYEDELKNAGDQAVDRSIFLDMADELLDSAKTVEFYQHRGRIFTYPGGSHGFEHMLKALPEIEKLMFANVE